MKRAESQKSSSSLTSGSSRSTADTGPETTSIPGIPGIRASRAERAHVYVHAPQDILASEASYLTSEVVLEHRRHPRMPRASGASGASGATVSGTGTGTGTQRIMAAKAASLVRRVSQEYHQDRPVLSVLPDRKRKQHAWPPSDPSDWVTYRAMVQKPHLEQHGDAFVDVTEDTGVVVARVNENCCFTTFTCRAGGYGNRADRPDVFGERALQMAWSASAGISVPAEAALERCFSTKHAGIWVHQGVVSGRRRFRCPWAYVPCPADDLLALFRDDCEGPDGSREGRNPRNAYLEALPLPEGHPARPKPRGEPGISVGGFGAYATRYIPERTHIADYVEHALVITDGESRAPRNDWGEYTGMADYIIDVRIDKRSTIVISGNPLLNPATMINDANGPGPSARPVGPLQNCEYIMYARVDAEGGGQPRLVCALVTTRSVQPGEELLADYGPGYWKKKRVGRTEDARTIARLTEEAHEVVQDAWDLLRLSIVPRPSGSSEGPSEEPDDREEPSEEPSDDETYAPVVRRKRSIRRRTASGDRVVCGCRFNPVYLNGRLYTCEIHRKKAPIFGLCS